MPTLVEIDKVFDHLMIQKVGEIDLLETTDLNANMAKFTKAQITHVVKERDAYKEKYEKLEEQVHQLEEKLRLIPDKEEFSYERDQKKTEALQDKNYWRYQAKKLQKILKKMEEQRKRTTYDMMTRLVTHGFNEMMQYANDYWNTYVGTFRAL